MADLVAATIAGLGTPSEDGARGVIRTANVEMPFTWNLEEEVWIGPPFVSMRINENIGIGRQGSPTDWLYPATAVENPIPVVNPTQARFFIHKVIYGGELYQAGLRLQEHLSGEISQAGGDSGDVDSEVALAWYCLEDGDPFLSPEPYNIGIRLIRDKDDDPTRYRWCSTGWQKNITLGVGNTMGEPNIVPLVDHHLYPEIYGFGCSFNLRKFTAKHRWIGGVDLGPSGSFEVPSKFPPFTGSGDSNRNVRGWYRADSIGTPIGDGVSHWADYSGYGRPFRQPSGASRPILTVSDLGSHKFLRFDGVDDYMGNHLADRPISGPEAPQPASVTLLAPYSFTMVVRQRASGGSLQAWAANQGGGANLIYRNGNSGELNSWIGSEPALDIGDWPSGWLIYSLRVNADNTYVIRINDVEVASGSGATAVFNGVMIGNRPPAFDLPAAIDLAEILYTYGDMTQAEQIALIDYLNDYYGIF